MLQSLQLESVQRKGYVNLRCNGNVGCPDEIQPFRDPREEHRTAEHAIADAWGELFGNASMPETIATPCCAQFVVSRNQVLKRPLADYQRYLDWLISTPLDDATSGRVFEYLWHVIFGQEAV